MRKKIALFLTLMLLLTPVYASSLNNKKSQLDNTKESIQNTKEALESTASQKEDIKHELQTVDQQIVSMEDSILDLQNKLDQKQSQLEKSEKDLELAIEKKDQQYNATKKRMIQMYKNQKIGYIQIVLSSESVWEAINRLEYIKRISKQDNDLVVSYQEQVEGIDKQKTTIEEERAELNVIHKEQVAKKGELTSARIQKDKKLTELAGQEERLQAEIKAMQDMSKKLEQEIKKLTEQSKIRYAGGAFNWPVPGFFRISSDYNPRTNPISGKYEFHSGIDIPASYGSSVVAAADGVVIKSGWISGYGNTVMINHGSGLVTLYAHNSSLAVSEGQTIKRGQTVAGIGSTGYSTGNHSHFEVRLNGSHTNPWNYIKK